jgi:hypothetical protein
MKSLYVAFFALSALAILIVTGCGTPSASNSSFSASPAVKTAIPVKLVFTTQPGSASAGSPLAPQPVVAIQDADGNTVAGETSPVTIVITSGTGNAGAILYGPATLTPVNGKARFNALYINKVGLDYTLTATAGNLSPAISAPFKISAAEAAKLAFTVQPSGGVAGTPFTTQPEVAVLDHFGNPVANYSGSITIAITFGSTTGAALSGKTTVPVTNGVAKFNDLSIDLSYPSFILTAMSNNLESANSSSFEIKPGKEVKLEFTIQPAGARAGQPFDTQPKVAVEDAYGNVVHDTGITVTISITSGSGVAGATLTGGKTEIAEGGLGGLAVYSGLSIDRPGTGYSLTAVGGSLAPAVSQKFDVTP